MTTTTDAIVIGAGVIGSSIAYQLAKRGLAVTVVDRAAAPGLGSSGSSSAIVRFTYSTLAGTLTAWESSFAWENWRDYLAAPAGEAVARLHRNGMVLLDAPVFPKERVIAHLATAGIRHELWSAQTLADRIPGISTGAYFPPKPITSEEFFDEATGTLGALYTPDAGFVDDPRLASANLAAAAERSGATLHLGARVVGIEQRPDSTWLLTTSDGEHLSAPVVVNAAGPWSGALNALAGVGAEFTVHNRPLRGEVHAVAAPAGLNPPGRIGPTVSDPDLGYYLRPEPSGTIIVGGMEPECDPLEWVEDPDEVEQHPSAAAFERQVTRAAVRFPSLAVPTRPAGLAAVYDVSDDWLPVYDKTDATGFYVAIGTSGNQFKSAPLVGELLAEIIASNEGGINTDEHPVSIVGRHTSLPITAQTFSRRRAAGTGSATVIG